MDLEELAMLLECVDVNSYTPTEFASALERAKTCSFEDDQKLVLYGLFKQATVGEINIESPPQSDMVNYAKWNAWRGFAGFPQNSAMASYVYLVESWENEKETKFDKFLDGNKLGGPSAMAPTVSTLLE